MLETTRSRGRKGKSRTISIYRFLAIVIVPWPQTCLQLIFLDVKVVLLVAALVTADPEAQLLLLRADHSPLGRDKQAVGVVEQDGERVLVVGDVVLPLRPEESRNASRQAKQMHHLVQQMCTQVVDGAAGRDHLVFPGVGIGNLRAMAVEMGLELDNSAQSTALDQLGSRDEVGVPASICTVQSKLIIRPLPSRGDGRTYFGRRPGACPAAWPMPRAHRPPCG